MPQVTTQTIEQYFQAFCENNGMFPDQAKAVVEQLKTRPDLQNMQDRWQDSKEGYAFQALMHTHMACCQEAVEWIDANNPGAWFRAIFAE